jgi:putative glutamine amidotransferase
MNKPPCMVWLPADHRLMGDHGHQMPFLLLGDKYARAVKVGAEAQPVMFPLADTGQISELLALVDGVMLTGSPSNVHPSHFDEAVADPSLPLDAERDLLTLALVKACVHEGAPPDEQYAPRHSVRFAPGSVFEQWAGGPEAQVNSLHGQGINRLAAGLEPLAHAPDGVVEAFGVRGARTFAYAVQFHPEWRCWETPFYAAIFEAFGRACRQRMNLRLQAADLSRSAASASA